MRALLLGVCVAGAQAEGLRHELLLQAQSGAQAAWAQTRWEGQGARLELEAQAREGEGRELRLGEAWWQQGALRLGRQRLAWGLTDTVSPSDLLNPRDWRDLSRPVKRPLWAASWQRGSWQAVLARAEPARLARGAWAFPLPPGLQAEQPAAPESRGQAALRWQARWAGQEATLLAYRGHSHAPRFELQGPRLSARHERLTAVAASWLRPLDGRSLLRAELGRFWGAQSAPFTQWVLSVDREWSLGEGSVYALLQTQRSHGAEPALGLDLRRALDRHGLMRLQYRHDEGWQLQLEAVLRRDSHFTRLSASRPLGGALELEAGAQFIGGRAGGFWANWRGQDRWFLRLRWVG